VEIKIPVTWNKHTRNCAACHQDLAFIQEQRATDFLLKKRFSQLKQELSQASNQPHRLEALKQTALQPANQKAMEKEAARSRPDNFLSKIFTIPSLRLAFSLSALVLAIGSALYFFRFYSLDTQPQSSTVALVNSKEGRKEIEKERVPGKKLEMHQLRGESGKSLKSKKTDSLPLLPSKRKKMVTLDSEKKAGYGDKSPSMEKGIRKDTSGSLIGAPKTSRQELEKQAKALWENLKKNPKDEKLTKKLENILKKLQDHKGLAKLKKFSSSLETR
jgi:hypothetical protein